MQQYPSIKNPPVTDRHIVAFDKIDGSNIRAEWTRKRGFHKFGTRRRLLGEDEKVLGRAIPLIHDNYADRLDIIFRQEKWDKCTAFFELAGPSSQFGWHDPEERQVVTLIDVHVRKLGILEPSEFIKLFRSLGIPNIVYQGPINQDFIDHVRHCEEGDLPGMGPEGVVCKTAFDRKLGMPYMFKLKRQSWYDRLKEWCLDDEEKYWRLK